MARRRKKSRKRGRVRAARARRSPRRSRKGRMPAALKAYWAAKRGGGGTVARRRGRKRSRARANPPRRHRRYRRNPLFGRSRSSGSGIVATMMAGAKHGAFVTLGEGVSAALPGLVKLPTSGLLGYAARIITGTVIGVFGKGVLGSENAAFFVAGAWSGVYRQLARSLPIPILGPALAGYPGPIQMRGYAVPRGGGVSPAGNRTGSTREGSFAGNLF